VRSPQASAPGGSSPSESTAAAVQAAAGSLESAAAWTGGAAALSVEDLLLTNEAGGPGMKLTDVAKHFQVSRQRSHQMMGLAVKHLKQQLRHAAANDAEVALLVGEK